MKKSAEDGSLGIVQGDTGYSPVDDKSLAGIIGLFQKRVEEEARNAQLVNTGAMLSDENFKQRITETENLTTIDLFMVYYADYVNQGVRGKDDETNAPNSPYKFRNYGMSEEGRKSILNSVTTGKMKISDVSKTKYGKIGLEAKGKATANQEDINQKEANQIIYLIKKYGIKQTEFINKAWQKFKGDLQDNITELAGKKIAFNIRKTLGK